LEYTKAMRIPRAFQILIGFLVVASFSGAQQNKYPMFPNAVLTPGDVLTTDAGIVCVSGYASSVRNVSASLKRTVYLAYGINKKVGEDFEVDHLISLQLGGSNDIKNLWPQSGTTLPLNYHVKDRLEGALHDLVCAGQISLEDAQRGIAANWGAIYKEVLGNLKDGTDPSKVTDSFTTSAPAVPIANPVSSNLGVPPNSDGSCPDTAPVKVSRSGIYHVPGSAFYDRTRAVVCFDTPEHAAAAGYRAPR
jgi:hypothetical protein